MIVPLEHGPYHLAGAVEPSAVGVRRGGAATVMARTPRPGPCRARQAARCDGRDLTGRSLDARQAEQYGQGRLSVRLANVNGRASAVLGERLVDVERASGGRFPADPMVAIHRWDALVEWARGLREGDAEAALDAVDLGPPVPRPAKVFAIGVNYREHAKEAGLELPKTPMVFTKFPSCLVGPRAPVVLSSAYVDWEVELVVAVGRRGRRIPAARALDHVAGYTIGQDISDRRLQVSDKPPQFCLGKSINTFGPIGPAVVSLDAFPDANDLALACDVSGA